MEHSEYTKMREVEDTHWWYVALHEKILSAVRAEGRSLKMLDVGCGTGGLLEFMTPYVDSAVGMDVSEAAVALARDRGMQALAGDLNSTELGTGNYDLITCIDVLYHMGVENDQTVLGKLYDALRPGGIVIINAPAYEFMRGPHDEAVHTARRYTLRCLRQAMSLAGFHVQSSTYRVCALFPFIMFLRLFGRMIGSSGSDVGMPPRIINSALLGLMRLENRMADIIPLPFGSSVFAVGKKI